MTTEQTFGSADTSPSSGGGPVEGLGRGALLGRYIVLDRLGAGGMGVVFSAYDPSLDRRLAIKVLRPGAGDGEAGELRTARMVREAQAMAQVSHRNVVTIYEVGIVEGRVFLAMEYIDGETLGAWLARQPTPRDVLRAFLDAGRGLAAAHARGLVHRDFKPDNVLVGRDGRVVVTDFGVAALVGARADVDSGEPRKPLAIPLTGAGVVVGTPGFMAPEQRSGDAVDTRADQFAFCVALHLALVGRKPFEGDAAVPRADRALPAWLRPIVLRGLANAPEARYPSMEALLAALSRGPAITPRRLAVVAGAAAAIALGALALPRAGAEVCTGFEARLAGVWDDRVAGDGAHAFSASGRAHAPDSWQRVTAALDGYTHDWVAMRTDACRATSVRGEQSAELLDLRNTCLDRRLAGVAALTKLLARADEGVIDRAVPAVLGLEPLDGCADREALTAVVPPPRDPATRAWVRDLRARVEQVLALSRAGKHREARAVAEVLAVEARATGHAPARADALAALASLRVEAHDLDAGPLLEEAVAAAAQARSDRQVAQGLIRLMTWQAERARHAEALALAPAIEAAASRAGDDPLLRAELDEKLGLALLDAGRWPEAETALRRAVAGRERLDDRSARLKAHTNLARALTSEGKFAEAKQHLAQARGLAEAALGPQHPAVGVVENELGTNGFYLREFESARGHYARALAIFELVYGAESVRAGTLVNNVAMIDSRLGRFEDARAGFLRALAIRERALGPDHPDVAATLNNLGAQLAQEGRLREARPLFERAMAIDEKALGPEHPNLAKGELNLGTLLLDDGQPAAALPHLRRAVAINLAHLEATHPDVAESRGTLGECLLLVDRAAEALPLLEAAHAFHEAHPTGHRPTRATIAFALARALTATRRDPARARALAQAARELAAGTDEVAAIDSWLARHR